MSKQFFSRRIEENERILKERLGVGVSFDVDVRELTIFEKKILIYFVTGLCDMQYVIEILRELMLVESRNDETENVRLALQNHLSHLQVRYVNNMDDAITEILSGLIVIVVEGEREAFVVDVRSYPGRGPEEPDTERVVRGARDGFTENIIFNTALTRRRIRDERLRHEIMRVGVRSKTDICIAYLEDVADPELIRIIKKELKAINIDGLTMADKVVEEFIVHQGANPFPLVRYTERPDVAATHILEGHVVIIVDGSPSVIITPTTLFHHIQHAEEFRQAPAVGTFLRWIRYIGMVLSLFILPFWLLLVMQPSLLPAELKFIGPNETTNIPIFAQIFMAELGIELLRMAAIHTPSPLATALGLVAALLIGEIAIKVGLFTAEVILYVAMGAIGTFATPSYELGIALKIIRLILLIAVALFSVKGFIIGTTLFIIVLTSIKSLNKPYLWPFIPFDPYAAKQILIRASMPSIKKRPSIVHPQDPIRQS